MANRQICVCKPGDVFGPEKVAITSTIVDTSRQAIVNYAFSRIIDYIATSYQAHFVTLARLRTARVALLKPYAHVRVVHGDFPTSDTPSPHPEDATF